MIKKGYRYNYYKKMGNLPHKNIKVNSFGTIERDDQFDFRNFYEHNVQKTEFLKELEERKIKDNNKKEGVSENCCC